MKRPVVLSIAGHDPSCGAGIAADIKTFEQHKVYGMGIISANTFQNDREFISVDWVEVSKQIDQAFLLYKNIPFKVVKIGLIKDFNDLQQLVKALKSLDADMKIIWDPILNASAGFTFHDRTDDALLKAICEELFLITPNYPEAQCLSNNEDAKAGAQSLSACCTVFLKGGHSPVEAGMDFLFTKNGKAFSFKPKGKLVYPKHGSGCILSASLTANTALGFTLNRSCLRAKQYTYQRLLSDKGLLAFHKT